MSVELQKAKRKLELIERLEKEPELILTDLYEKDDNVVNLLYQVDIKGEYILYFLQNCLSNLPVFDGTSLKFHGDNLYVIIPALKYGKYKEYQSDDRILELDLAKKEVLVLNKFLKEYQEIIDEDYRLEVSELDDFWKKYENFGFKNRLKLSVESFTKKKRFGVKVSDFFFMLTVPKKKIETKLETEKEKVRDKNKHNKECFENNIARQEYYAKNAPKHTSNAISKQNEIVYYLEKLGYTVKTEVSMGK